MSTSPPSVNSAEAAAQAVKKLCDQVQADPNSPHSVEIQQSAALARVLQRRANELQTPAEKRQQSELDRMIQNPNDKVTLTQLTDQAFRSTTPHRAVDQLVHILDVQGIPRFFTPVDRALLKGFQSFGSYLPGVAVPLVKDKMQQETANVILPAEEELLTGHLRERRQEGVRMNVNYLGEALLGEDDAQLRLKSYLQALQLPDIEVMSVKVSTIYSQISQLSYDHSVEILCDRMEMLYRASAKASFTRTDGSTVKKFVYLDMEEYRDMRLTAEVFMKTLDRSGLENVSAGIVLQAYIPDSFRVQQQITAWAKKRTAAGGAPITIRIVKGANMEMERFESGLHGWPQAPYKEKLDTDANYRRMVRYGMQSENIAAVTLGIASHNLFELAHGLVLALKQDAFEHVQFEMLEGMANHQRRAIFELCNNLLLYAPACRKQDFIHAIGYLVRRLDENTGPDNFLRHAFHLTVDSPEWKRLEEQFFAGFERIAELSDEPRRIQDRRQPPAEMPDVPWQEFQNESDTDFALPQNLKWAKELIANWKGRHGDAAINIPLTIAGKEVEGERDLHECLDPSRPETIVGRYRQANGEDLNAAVACAKSDDDGWRTKSAAERRTILRKVAQEIREARADLMGAAMADGGKTLPQSDPEVSEAVDFVEFYASTADYFSQLTGIETQGRGVVLVVSPWNFPIAIPCGGIAAALAAGNTVILKPASDTVLVAYQLCKCFWRAGVSQKTLQLVPCSGRTAGEYLIPNPDVDTVILTGGTDTALTMLKTRSDLRLLAETGGKNATIVTAMADRDQAIKDVIYSAFGHAGQKCSATSLLILEGEVYDDENFKRALCDAARSMKVGSAWDLETKIGPVIRPPSGDLETALKELETGESWALMPQHDDDNPHLQGPGIKWGVSPGSYTHCTEFFGPMLGVMKAKDIHEAIDFVNFTGFGLTSGLQSLDDREQEIWLSRIRAGNLYINRGTTGAIVLRQPFGGMGKSAFGPGIKAGGPNYVAQLMKFQEIGSPQGHEDVADEWLTQLKNSLEQKPASLTAETIANSIAAIGSYDLQMSREFSQKHDHFKLTGQDNFRRYLPVQEIRIRIDPNDTEFENIARVCAARAAGCRITVSSPIGFESASIDWLDQVTEPWAAAIEFVEESDVQLADVIRSEATLRVRYAASDRVPEGVRRAAATTGLYIADAPVLMNGRIELLWYMEEQSISDNYHRYGNLGSRVDEERAPVA